MSNSSLRKLILAAPILLLLIRNNCFSQNTDPSLIIGTYRISKVIDGDTFRFDGIDKSARLLGIDTEETFKTPDAGQKADEIALNWEAFYKNEKGSSKMPVKCDSPFGYESWKWAEEFFSDVDSVRLEKEDEERTVDIYGRYLVYVIAYKKGQEINYNVECVRQGHSPYFNKYGNSKRFNNEFKEAQNYAKENKIGIWDDANKHYPDYEERLVWWNKRAEQLNDFDIKYSADENYFNLSSEKDFNRLSDYQGKEIVVFGSIGDILTKKFPYLIRIPHDKIQSFEIVVTEENQNLMNETDIDTLREYYVYVKGKLEVFNGNYQIKLINKDQIRME